MAQLPKTYTGPGLVDLQINGYAGFDFNGDPSTWCAADFHALSRALLRRGVVTALPTLVTDDVDRILARARRYAEILARDEHLRRSLPKLHVEGPFISPADGPRGAHPKRYCMEPAAMPDFVDRLREASGDRVGIVTLAPEMSGAIDLIRSCAEAGICPAIGHTQASPDELDQAVLAGAKMSTHLGNGSHPTLPRLDSYIQRQLADDRLMAGFIADGHHVPFTTLKNFIRAKTLARSVLVTDAIMPTELGPGTYGVIGSEVEVSPEGRAAVPGAPNLAGSVLTMDMAVINTAMFCDIEFEQAWTMASTRPAEIVGLGDQPHVAVSVEATGFRLLDESASVGGGSSNPSALADMLRQGYSGNQAAADKCPGRQ